MRPAERSRRRWLVAVALAAVPVVAVAVLVLDQPGPDPPAPTPLHVDWRVEWDGCADVRLQDGEPLCVVDPEQALRLWIEHPPVAQVEVVVDGAVVPAERYAVAGETGEGLRVEAPPGARALTLRVAGASSAEPVWSLPLGSAASETPRELMLARTEIGVAIGERDAERARRAVEQAYAVALEQGRLEDAVDIVLEVVFNLSQRHLDPEIATGLLLHVEAAAQRYPKGRGDLACYRGLHHWFMGANQDAAEQLRDAARQARRLEAQDLAIESIPMYASALAQLGYYDDALHWAREGERLARAHDDHCTLGSVLRTVGWVMLELRRRDLIEDEPTRFFEEALEIFREGGRCPQPRKLGGAHLSLAVLALDQNRIDDAAQQLEQIDRHKLTLDERLHVDDTELRVSLARASSPELRRTAYQRLQASVEAVDTPDGRWRLHTRHGRLLELEGDAASAIEAYRAAELELDALVRLQAVGIGRGELAERYHESIDALVSQYVSRGDVGEAWCIVRQDQARRRAAAVVSAALDPAQRADLDETIRRYRGEKLTAETLEARARDKPRDEAEGMLQTAAQARNHARTLANELAKTLGRLAPKPRCTELSPPAPDELLLGLYPRERDWLVFASDASETTVHVVPTPRLDDRPEALDELTRALLGPVRPQLDGARRLRVLAHRQAQHLDVHRLPWGNEPLGVRMPVSYGVELLGRPGLGPSKSGSRALLVADPTNTLVNAEAEVALVDARLSAAGWTTEINDPLEPRVVSLAGYDLFHYAGHAEASVRPEQGGWPPYPGGEAGWAGYLELGKAGQLTVHDVITMSVVPRAVVLAGCRTGALELDTGQTSLALAFLVAGSEQVVASAEAVDDARGARFARGFYAALVREPGVDLAVAMQQAERELWVAGAEPAGYRVWVR